MSSVRTLRDYIENNLEKIGIVGSPSKLSEIKVDILEQATDKNLLGSLCVIPTTQGDKDLFIFGQITEVELRNVWVEQPTIRGIIKQKGPVSPISGEHDLYTGTLSVISVFSYDGIHLSRESLGRVPPTSSPVYIVNKEFMDEFNRLFGEDRNFTFIGKYYGTEVLIPFEFRDFSKNGIGEAIHIGVFGKTGSGKSWLARMVLLGYAKNRDMGIFVIDSQGEFSKGFAKGITRDITNKLGKEVKIVDIGNLRLVYPQKEQTLEALEKMLLSVPIDEFWKDFGIFTESKKILLIKTIIESLDDLSKSSRGHFGSYSLNELLEDKFDEVLKSVKSKVDHIYSGKTSDGKQRQEAFKRDIDRNKSRIKSKWRSIAKWFIVKENENISVSKVVENITDKGTIFIINFSEETVREKGLFWNDNIKYFILNELISHIKLTAEKEYLSDNTLNTLVILDEAHRFAPYETPTNEELARLKRTLVDAVRTTRKYGIGWMFISQTFSSIDKEILNQLRVFFIGYGLNYGSEWNKLREIMGGEEVLEIYRTFGDPLVDKGTRRPSFIVKGPIIPFIPTSKAIAIDVLHFPDEFIEANFPDLSRGA